MEFRFRAKDERVFPSNPFRSSDSSPPSQALQVGSVSYSDLKNLLPGGRTMEELQKELLEEKIRGEIIAQRIRHKRMLEEEAQRNFELNHKMSKNATDDHQSSLLVNNMGANVVQRLPSSVIEELKEMPMPMEIDTPVKDDSVCEKRRLSTTSEETHEVKHQKIVNELGCALQKTQKTKEKSVHGEMYCTICGVRSTSKSALIEHEKGKKHRAKVAKFNPSNDNESPSNDKKNADLDKANTRPPSTNTELSCILCDIRVTCKFALEQHQKGKRHLANVIKKKKITDQNGEIHDATIITPS